MNKQQTIFTVQAPAGAGKTFHVTQKAVDRDEHTLFVVPTIDLAEQIGKRLNQLAPDSCLVIHSGNTKEVVTAISYTGKWNVDQIAAHALDNKTNKFIVVTDQSFQVLSHQSPAEWHVIKDEVVEPLTFQFINSESSRQLVEQYLSHRLPTAEELNNRPTLDGMRFVTFKTTSKTATGDNTEVIDANDTQVGHLRKWQRMSRTGHFEILSKIATDANGETNSSNFHLSGMLMPSIFAPYKSTTLLSAEIEHTMLYLFWSKMVNFEDVTSDYVPSRRYADRDITIHYGSDEYAGSKKSRTATNKAGISNGEAFIKQAIEHAKNNGITQTGYVIHDDDEKTYAQHLQQLDAQKIPHQSHGLNNFSHLNALIIGTSYNENPQHERFFRIYEATTRDSTACRTGAYHYQQAMRCSLRNYGATEPVHIYVPTKNDALELLTHIQDAVISDMNDATKWKLKPDFVRKTTAQAIKPTQRIAIPYTPNLITKSGSAVSHIIESDLFTYIKDYHSKAPSLKEYLQTHGSNESDTNMVKEFKNDLPLIGVGQIIDQNKSFTNDNFVNASKYAFFDMDGTDIHYKDIQRVVSPSETGPLKILYYTTCSNGKTEGKYNYRFIIELSRPVTQHEYSKIVDYVKSRFADKAKRELSTEKKLLETASSPAIKVSAQKKIDYILYGKKDDRTGKYQHYYDLDLSKIKLADRFFLPHAEAELTTTADMQRANKNKVTAQPLDVDKLLMGMPRDTLYVPITDADLMPVIDKATLLAPAASASKYDLQRAEKITDILATCRSGNYSRPSTQLGGHIKHIQNQELKNILDAEIRNTLYMSGKDTAKHIATHNKYSNK